MYFESLLVAGLAAQAAAAPSTSLVTTFEERGIDALEKRTARARRDHSEFCEN